MARDSPLGLKHWSKWCIENKTLKIASEKQYLFLNELIHFEHSGYTSNQINIPVLKSYLKSNLVFILNEYKKRPQ